MWEKESKSTNANQSQFLPQQICGIIFSAYVIKPLQAGKPFTLLLLQHFLNTLSLGAIQ